MVQQAEKPERQQSILGTKGLLFFLVLSNMCIPLSTDMYLPALPTMSDYFGASVSLTNLTITAFFVFYGLGILLWGPMSDKFGRRPTLLIGAAVYLVASFCCAVATNIYFLIAARIFQGFGAGSIITISIAVIKDCFQGPRRESTLALIHTLGGLGPMIAPIFGALMLRVASWRFVFLALGIIGCVSFILICLFRETLPEEERYHGTLWGSITHLKVLLKNKSFLIPAILFPSWNLPVMGYIALSSFIYEDFFGLSEQAYSFFFAGNAAIALMGPMIYIKFLRRLNKRRFATALFVISAVVGVLVLLFGPRSPWAFLFCYAPYALIFTTSRPFSVNLTLDQHDGDSGSASSLITFSGTILGSVGTVVASLAWSNIIHGLGGLIITVSLVMLMGWLLFLRSPIPLRGVKDVE